MRASESRRPSNAADPSDEEIYVHCVVTLAHRHVKLRISALDSVGSLVELTKAKLHKKYPYEEFTGAVNGVRSTRLDKDLFLGTKVADVIHEGDILEARSYTVAAETDIAHSDVDSARNAVMALLQAYEKNIGVTAKLGTFTVTPVQAEGLITGASFRSPRVSLSVCLSPYEQQTLVPPASGSEFLWTNASVMVKHTDPAKHSLFILVRVFDDSTMGRKACIAMAGVPLQDPVESPGVARVSWVAMDSVGDYSTQLQCGRLKISVSFHPKAIQGPTVHNLLKNLLTETQQSPAVRDVQRIGSGSVSVFSSRSKAKKGKLTSLPQEPVKQQVKAHFKFVLRSLHLCSSRCTGVHGHSDAQGPDFNPIVRITFADFVHELHLDVRDCKDINFEQEWPVYSSFSKVEIEVLRKATVGGATHRLIDGTYVYQVCTTSISCHGVQVLQASDRTTEPPPAILGPGKAPPEPDCSWVSLHHDDDEYGVAQVFMNCKEDYAVILNGVEGPDVSFIPADEREFDAAIVHRNIERLDELVLIVKAIQLWVAETLDWKYPLRTVVTWSVLTYMCIYTPAGNLPFYMISALIMFLVVTFLRFRSGVVHKTWIEERPGSCRRGVQFRPVATLRVVPVSAKNLKDHDNPAVFPDTFVKIYYEPNFKDIPVQLIAQTECARKTDSPIWALAQPDSRSPETFSAMNARWIKEKVRNLSRYEQDAVLQDIVEPWPRADGHVDTHAFRYRILQAAQINPRTGAEELIPWPQSPGAIRFDILQESNCNQPTLIGRARVPIRSLVSDDKNGGPQLEQEIVLPLATPIRAAGRNIGQASSEELDNESISPSIVTRMQLVIRDPKARTTLTETIESEAMYSIIEMEHEKELSLVAKYHRAKDVAKNIQQSLGQFCSFAERFKNLLLWVHPTKTLLVLLLAMLGCIWLWLIPANYILAFSIAKRFTQKFHNMIDTDMVRLQNFLCTIPNDLEMRKIFYRRNQEFLRRTEHIELTEKLQADWSGLLRKNDGLFHSWKERYCVLRGGRLEYWESVTDAKAGVAPKGSMLLSSTTGEITKAESAQIPHDWYPIVLYDVSRRYLTTSPRRRVLCAYSKDEREKLLRVVHASGETLPLSRLPSYKK